MRSFLFVFLFSLSFYPQPSSGAEKALASERKSITNEAGKEVSAILKKNDELFNAFLKKDSKEVEKKASELAAIAKESKSDVLKAVRSGALHLNAIKSSNDNDTNLISYEKFLNPLITVVKENKVDQKYNIFSCPMVNKSWIQDTTVQKKVRNVYAMEMLECGSQDTRF